jgi:hypothetical protein
MPLVLASNDLTFEQATQVYPNPHEGKLNVKTVLKKAGEVSLVVTDVGSVTNVMFSKYSIFS